MNSILKFLISLIILERVKSETYTPIFIAEVFRQGSSTPNKNILNMQEFSKIGLRKIMPNGMRQQFALGKQIAKNYSDLFSTIKDPLSELKIYTSNSESCVLSAQAHLLGIYPQNQGQKITSQNKDVLNPPFQFLDVIQPGDDFGIEKGYFPVAYSVRNSSDDDIFMEDLMSTCSMLKRNTTIAYHENVKEFEKWEKNIFENLNKKLKSEGFDPEFYFKKGEFGFEDIVDFWDSVTSYIYYFGQIYKGMTDELYQSISAAASINKILFMNDKSKLYTTKITDLVLKAMDNFEDKTSHPYKYIGFSAGDTNIMSFLTSLGLTSIKCLKTKILSPSPQSQCKLLPAFAGNLIFELNKPSSNKNNIYYVRMLYNGKPLKICEKGTEYCEFSEFALFASENFIEENFDQYCTKNVKDYKTVAYIIVNLLILGVIVSLSVYISKNRSKVIKIGGVNRLVEVFSDNATMKNVIAGYREEDMFSELDYDNDGEEEKDKEGKFKSMGEKKRGIDDESIDYGTDGSRKFKTEMAFNSGKKRKFSLDNFFT